MTSNKPYFIRALYEWILDNNCTPYIVVDATLPFVEVPEQFISEGKIILNILPSATHNLYLGDDWITFSARFSGVSQEINIPMGAVAAIYAQENGEGMGFQTEALPEDYFEETIIKIPSKTTHHKPQLNVVENDSEKDAIASTADSVEEANATDKMDNTEQSAPAKPKSAKKSTATTKATDLESPDKEKPQNKGAKKVKKPTLTIIK